MESIIELSPEQMMRRIENLEQMVSQLKGNVEVLNERPRRNDKQSHVSGGTDPEIIKSLFTGKPGMQKTIHCLYCRNVPYECDVAQYFGTHKLIFSNIKCCEVKFNNTIELLCADGKYIILKDIDPKHFMSIIHYPNFKTVITFNPND